MLAASFAFLSCQRRRRSLSTLILSHSASLPLARNLRRSGFLGDAVGRFLCRAPFAGSRPLSAPASPQTPPINDFSALPFRRWPSPTPRTSASHSQSCLPLAPPSRHLRCQSSLSRLTPSSTATSHALALLCLQHVIAVRRIQAGGKAAGNRIPQTAGEAAV
jgi:hypothetical protein